MIDLCMSTGAQSRRARSGFAITGMLVLLVGCGSSSKTASTTTTTTTTTTTAALTPTSQPATTTAPLVTSAVTTAAPKNSGRGLAGAVSVVAGNAKQDGSGVPGPAATASLGSNVHYAVAANDDVYVSTGGLAVLKISGGQVSVFAKLDAAGGPGGGVAVGSDGSVFVATSSTIVKFDSNAKATIVLTAKAANLSTSLGPIAIDSAGNLYIADGSRRITKLAPDGKTTPFAGTGTQAPADSAVGDGGSATASPLGAPTQLFVDVSGNVLIADTAARRVRRVGTDGIITTIAGGGATLLNANAEVFAADGTSPTDVKFSGVTGIAVDAKGRIYIADGQSHAIVRFGASGGIALVIADQKGGVETEGSPASQTRATNVTQLGFDAKGDLLYIDSSKIRAIAGAAG